MLKEFIKLVIAEALAPQAIVAYVQHEYIAEPEAFTKKRLQGHNLETINAWFRVFGDKFKGMSNEKRNNMDQLLDFLTSHSVTHVADPQLDDNPIPLQKWCAARGITPEQIRKSAQRTAAIKDLLTPKKRGR